ncbi:MAG: sugar transferase [Lachnospiraceae bacterium]|nr:sugar transferase [Lachnospiraceae bacterium]
MKRQEAFRRFFVLLAAAIMIAVQTVMIFYVLHYNYNQDFRTQLYTRGHLFVTVLYMLIYVMLGKVFGGLLVGVRRKGEVLFSQVFTSLLSNIIFYLEMMMLSYKFPTVVPLFGVTGLQIIFASIWIAVTGSLYQSLFKPYDVLLIYEGEATNNFLQKLKTRKDQFHVVDSISAKESLETIFSKINENSTIMLWDIKASLRNTIFKYCYENAKRIYVMPKISDIILNGSKPVHLFDTPLLLTEGNPLQYEERIIKRSMDFMLALCAIMITSPIMLLAAFCIKVYDGGPVLYKQIRCTKNNREFEIYKFRSMVVDAEKAGKALLAKENDSRITPIGRVIRKIRIDELPQFFNVLKGDMSFVGPRPERPEFIKKYIKDMPEFSYRVKVRAGITGYAQLYGKYNTLPYDKLKLDLYYIEQYSIWLDIKLMILTIKILFTMESTEGIKDTEREKRE